MKHTVSTKSILMAAAAALSIASASAQTVIYITGATAFRSAANNTLYSMFSNNLYATTATNTSFNNYSGAVALYFTNCPVPGDALQRVDIAVTWTGSEAGIRSVASRSGSNVVTVPFYDFTKIRNGVSNNPAVFLTPTPPYLGVPAPDTTGMTASTYTTLAKGMIGFSDTFQESSRFRANQRAGDGRTYDELEMRAVGVVPYSWIASRGWTNNFPERNMTYFNAFQALDMGVTTGNMYSGKTNDSTIKIFTVGRNIDSGTRVITLANLRYGVTTPVRQFQCFSSNGIITNMAYSPVRTINGITTSLGRGGESSGGTLADYMVNVITNSARITTISTNDTILPGDTNYLVGYVSVADITAARRNAGLTPLKYNGVEGRCHDNASFGTLDAGYTNIINGSYPFWGYEFVTYNKGLSLTSNVRRLADGLVSKIQSFSSTNIEIAPNINLMDMRVGRDNRDGNFLLPVVE
jgi:hypothetical protein